MQGGIVDRRRLRPRLRFHAAILLAIGACAVEAQTLQLFGTWKLNAAKSTMAGPPPKSQTVTFRPSGPDAVTGMEDTVYADGAHTTIEYTAKTDGREYSIAGSPEILARADTISMRRVDALTIEWSYKKRGGLVLTLPGALSADGRTLTMTAAGNVLVYERQ